MKNKFDIKSFSISAEELSLILGMIGKPDLGRNVLKGIYDPLSEERADGLLTAASHSLVARSLVTISKEGKPVIIPELEQALLPFARFDYIINLKVTRDNRSVMNTIRVTKNKRFTSQFVKGGVVHVIESDHYDKLPAFLLDALEGFVEEERPNPSPRTEQSITMGTLGSAIEAQKNQKNIAGLFSEIGWPQEAAKLLEQDIRQQIIRASFLRINASSDMAEEQLATISKPTMLLLKGRKSSWVFDFNASDDQAEGIACTVLQEKEFEEKLRSLLCNANFQPDHLLVSTNSLKMMPFSKLVPL